MEPLLPTGNLTLFITASLVLLLTPGPNILYIMGRCINQGRSASLVSVLAVQTGSFIHISAAALGLSALLVSSALAFETVRFLGAAYLVYLGIRSLRERNHPAALDATPISLRSIYQQGLVVAILNPKTALFFFAFFPQFINPSAGAVPLQIMTLGVLYVALGLCVDGLYAWTAVTASRWLRGNAQFQRRQRTFSGLVFIGLGLSMALTGGRSK